MDIIGFLLIGLVAGWLAGQLVKGGGFGVVGDLCVGVIGALLGGFLFRLLNVTTTGLVGDLVMATVGAVVFLFILRAIKRASVPESCRLMTADPRDLGITFQVPENWTLQSSQEGDRTTFTLEPAGEGAFVMVVVDRSRAAPSSLLRAALDGLESEYKTVDSVSVRERLAGRAATGFDVEFFALDFPAFCKMRSYRTPAHTILLMGQWSDDDTHADTFDRLARSLREVSGADLTS